METIWELLDKSEPHSVDEVVSVLLKNRGIKTEEQKSTFFNPVHPNDISLKQVGLSGSVIKKVIKRILVAQKKGETVIIYGDYDVDGVAATSILWLTLFKLGVKVLPFIPNRFTDGYGMKPKSITALKNKYPDLSLIISVDNGIVAHSAVDCAAELGIEVILTDHHEPSGSLPNALAIVHSIQICGSALAWILCREILRGLDESFDIDSLLALSGLGTIADQMSLKDTNRSFAYYGLLEINRTKIPGLVALLNNAELKSGSIGPYEVGYLIGPRINAAGRLADATDAVRLFCTKDPTRAQELSKKLSALNLDRQKIVEEVIEHSLMSADSANFGITVVKGDYHEGVIGLASAKLVEKFNKPAIVISVGEKTSKGSARSISGIHITDLIRELDHLLVDAGGHAMAAGFSVLSENVESFVKAIQKSSTKYLETPDIFTKKLKIDLSISFAQINWSLVEMLSKFQPTGLGNPSPSFLVKGASVNNKKVLGSASNHLKLTLSANGAQFEAICFNMGALFDKINKTSLVDAVFSVEENSWNGKRSIQLKVKDLKIYDKPNIQ